MSFISNIEQIRQQARQKIEDGALTPDYQLNPEEAISILNEALATEIVCTLRYRFHYFMATGIHSKAVADEFLEHANEEQEHADRIAERIKQLGGKPEMNPSVVAKTSHTDFTEGSTLSEMLKENLIAERIAIETYREIVNYFGEKDPTSRRMIEDILAVEEEHADDLADLLFAMEPDGEKVQRLYFNDEIPGTSAAGTAVKAAAGQNKGMN
jgi:bacterioferritin